MNATSTESPDLAALSAWAPELAKTFASLASDIALVIDEAGVIRHVAQGGADPIASSADQWVGRAWIDTVNAETRPKIAKLLNEASTTGIARRREVIHTLGVDASVPVAYTAVRLGERGPLLAVGRNLCAIAAIQQRYVESQLELERGYSQARQAEARYQLLFQVATDAVIVVDAVTLQIIEANRAAALLFGASAGELQGRHIGSAFEHHSRAALAELFSNTRTTGQCSEIRARLQATRTGTNVLATPFRTEDTMRMLVRIRTTEGVEISEGMNQTLARLVDSASDGVVVTDSIGRILIANPAFMALAQFTGETPLKGQPLMHWVGLDDEPLGALVAQVRRDGVARQIDSWVKRGEAPAVQVELSAALLTEGDQECIGFTMHPLARVSASPAFDTAAGDSMARVLRAGLAALGPRLREDERAAVVRNAAAMLGVDPAALTSGGRRDAGDSTGWQVLPNAS